MNSDTLWETILMNRDMLRPYTIKTSAPLKLGQVALEIPNNRNGNFEFADLLQEQRTLQVT